MNHLPYEAFSDEDLFSLIKNDDQRAFKELYNRYWSFLLDAAYKPLQSRDQAEDIVQEIFISLYQRRHAIGQVVSLKGYLCKALKYKVLNEFRCQEVRGAYQKAVFFSGVCKNDFANSFEIRELNQAIADTVGKLPGKCKQAFLLSRQEDLSYKDISTKLDISVSTVEKHISKALKSIKLSINLYL